MFLNGAREAINKFGVAQYFGVGFDVFGNNRVNFGARIARLTAKFVFIQTLQDYNST